jgi:site-specific DNA recombinase
MARKSRAQPLPIELLLEMALWKAGLYTRISVEDGDNTEQNSIGNQIKIGNHFIAGADDIRLVDTYSDNGYTGMNFERPGFQRLLADIRAGKINCVIVKDISRLGRHFVMTSNYVERIFPELGVRLICINDEYDSSDADADASALTLPLKMVMNDYYVKDISRKIRSSIHAKMGSGEYLPASGSIPYGYMRDPENNTFAIDTETAPIVLRIFQMRADGISFNGICRTLNAEGIPCPGKLRYDRGLTNAPKYKDAVWIRGTVRKIIQDRVYIGCRVHGKISRSKVGLDKQSRPEDEWTVIQAAHPALVSDELFEYVQQINAEELEKRRQYARRNDFQDDYRELFRGLIYCADCHSSMSAGKGCARIGANTPSRIFYDCNTYRYSEHTRCASHYVRQEQIYSVVKNALDQQVKVAVDIEQLVAATDNLPNGRRTSETAGRLAQISQQRKKLEGKIEQLLIDLTDGLISRDEYVYMKEKYTQQMAISMDEEEKAQAQEAALHESLSAVQTWLYAIKTYRALPELNQEVLRLLIKEILIYKDRHIQIVFNYADPYKLIAKLQNHMEEVRNVV